MTRRDLEPDHDAAALRRFAEALRRYATRSPPFVELVPNFAPETVAFWKECPDRLLCGRKAFDVLRARGFVEAKP
jgi:hypothetical protein